MDIRKNEQVLLISFCALVLVPLLYICRSADTNTFTSWRWVFADGRVVRVFFLLPPALLCAYALSRLSFPEKYTGFFLFILSLAAVLPLWTEPETVIDASRYFIQAKSLKEFGVTFFLREWGHAIDAWTDLPLMPFLYGLVFSWLGEARVCIQALTSILFALTALLTYRIGEQLWDRETGLQAGLLLLGIPYLLTQVPLMLVDVPAMFFLTLAIYAFLQALEKGGILLIAASALSIFTALLSKYSTWPMLLIVPVIAAVFRKDEKKIIGRTFIILLFACLVAGLAIILRVDVFRSQIELLRTYQWAGLGRWQESFASTFLFQTHPFITAFALFGIYRAVKMKDFRFLIAGWFAVVVLLLQIKRIRYLLPLFPLFVLMASYGLNAVREKGIRMFICLCIAAASLAIVYSAYLPFLNTTSFANLKHAGQYLDTLSCDSVEVDALPQTDSSGSSFAAIPLLDYYTNKNIFCPREWPSHPVNGRPETSSMRFTWEMKRPVFYEPSVGRSVCASILISDGIGGSERVPLRREVKRFGSVSDVFRYRTVVSISNNDLLSQTGQPEDRDVPSGTIRNH